MPTRVKRPAPAHARRKPGRRRRKEARPGEIIAAATEVFSEYGFGAAKLEEVARRAQVSKGTVFVYFPNKRELFRAVAQSVLERGLGTISAKRGVEPPPLQVLVPKLLQQVAVVAGSPASAIVRILIGEGRAFPDLAQVWYDEVVVHVTAALMSAIRHAQRRGEARAGDPRLFVFSIVGPMLAAVIFRQAFSETGAAIPDLTRLATQHAGVVLRGIAR